MWIFLIKTLFKIKIVIRFWSRVDGLVKATLFWDEVHRGFIFKRSWLIFQYISGTFNFLIIFTLFKLKAPTSSKSVALFEISVALFEIKIAILRFEGCFFHEHLKFSNALFNFFVDPFSWSRRCFLRSRKDRSHSLSKINIKILLEFSLFW